MFARGCTALHSQKRRILARVGGAAEDGTAPQAGANGPPLKVQKQAATPAPAHPAFATNMRLRMCWEGNWFNVTVRNATDDEAMLHHPDTDEVESITRDEWDNAWLAEKARFANSEGSAA